jgi:predicted CopG family antitoxin
VHDKCMAVKTITIDLEAYEALARHKRKGESFSRVIKEHFGRRRTGREFAALVKTLRFRDETVSAIDKMQRKRKRDRAQVPRL